MHWNAYELNSTVRDAADETDINIIGSCMLHRIATGDGPNVGCTTQQRMFGTSGTASTTVAHQRTMHPHNTSG
jgi:hypothetical protein